MNHLRRPPRRAHQSFDLTPIESRDSTKGCCFSRQFFQVSAPRLSHTDTRKQTHPTSPKLRTCCVTSARSETSGFPMTAMCMAPRVTTARARTVRFAKSTARSASTLGISATTRMRMICIRNEPATGRSSFDSARTWTYRPCSRCSKTATSKTWLARRGTVKLLTKTTMGG